MTDDHIFDINPINHYLVYCKYCGYSTYEYLLVFPLNFECLSKEEKIIKDLLE